MPRIRLSRRLMCALLPLSALGIGSAAEEPLPKADAVLDKFVQVTGGKAGYEKVHSEITTATMEIVGRGVKGTFTMYRAEPNKNYTVVDFEGVGRIEEGTDGKVAWEKSAMAGPRIKAGEEKDVMIRNAAIRAPLEWRKQYEKAEMSGVENVGDDPCYKITLTPASGKPEIRFFDKKSGLLVKVVITLKTPMGEIPSENYFSEYKDVGGISTPMRMQQKALGQEILLAIQDVKLNAEIAKDKFELPADVRVLVDKANAPQQAAPAK